MVTNPEAGLMLVAMPFVVLLELLDGVSLIKALDS